jgi:hypothetical protein
VSFAVPDSRYEVLSTMSPNSRPAPPSSRAPAGVPPSGNGKYIAVVVLLLVGLVVLLALRFCGPKDQTGGPKPIASVDAAPTPHTNPDDLVPPPPPPEEPPPDSGPTKVTTGGGTFDPCGMKTCSGQNTPDLEAGLAFRAKQAHRCYDMALAQDATLKGKIGITVRVAANGQVCRADVASNDMGSPSVAQCVANMFRQSAHFAPPKGGCIDATIPISFVPGGK